MQQKTTNQNVSKIRNRFGGRRGWLPCLMMEAKESEEIMETKRINIELSKECISLLKKIPDYLKKELLESFEKAIINKYYNYQKEKSLNSERYRKNKQNKGKIDINVLTPFYNAIVDGAFEAYERYYMENGYIYQTFLTTKGTSRTERTLKKLIQYFPDYFFESDPKLHSIRTTITPYVLVDGRTFPALKKEVQELLIKEEFRARAGSENRNLSKKMLQEATA